jgi:rhomboid protease GluP
MTVNADGNPLVGILQLCASSAPQPWYPSAYAKEKGIDRDSLDPHLDRLRMGGLVQLTDWVQGTGQGYRLTPEGERVLQTPRDLAVLGDGQLPQQKIVEQVAGPQGSTSAWDRGEAIRNSLLDSEPPRATQVLLFANIAVFLVGLALAGKEGLASPYLAGTSPHSLGSEKLWEIQHELGAITGTDLVRGQWWKLISSCFVHFGLIHLLVNMYTLYVLGPQSEKMWGRWRFLLIYFICGLGGSCAVVWNNPEAGGAGASGALWGLMTSYLAWVFLNREYLPGALSPERLRAWLSVLLINVFISMMPGISAAAHFGGGAVGVPAA